MKGRIISTALFALIAGGAHAAPSANSDPQAPAHPSFAGHDRNDDGRLTPGELPEWDKQAFEEADTDGDGNLSEEEYGQAVAATNGEVARPLPSENTVGTIDEGQGAPLPARNSSGAETAPMGQ